VLALGVTPTTENLAKMIYEYAEECDLPVVEVTLWETPYSYATYSGPSSDIPF
jgi:6-pyruvoyl-tetrahydropterin synthase